MEGLERGGTPDSGTLKQELCTIDRAVTGTLKGLSHEIDLAFDDMFG